MKKKIIKITFGLLVLIALTACSGDNGKSDAYGNFEAIDLIVSAQGNGQILEFEIMEGQVLHENQEVGLIDTSMLHLQKKQLQSNIKAVASKMQNVNAQVEVQQQQLENLLIDQKRLKALFRDGAATKKQLDDINGAVDLTRKQITATKTQKQNIRDEIDALYARIEQVNESIRDCHIINPAQGTVLTKFAEQGEFTATGKPLYKIANLEVLNLKVYVSGDQLPEVRIGEEVEVLIDKNKSGFTHLKGRINWISDQAEFTPKTIQTKKERVNLVYAVKVRVKNDGSLKIGMPGEINF
ncbi:MAG: HlyD family efflux transporter periplasmic adaptor subunit [Bacteroidales bacterium]|nr:HlyD family efflux transporter periplasmic adaptor subunit [Bacteroidales bacterium]MCF8386496.1 HlyD family efflux transporter periplasmic adaptor subunit [Bacteroidales bacterium]MCF8397100.1 HlyD family efflux transporter periplasmic adaptor subunit [Bacteroidales bacterium]